MIKKLLFIVVLCTHYAHGKNFLKDCPGLPSAVERSGPSLSSITGVKIVVFSPNSETLLVIYKPSDSRSSKIYTKLAMYNANDGSSIFENSYHGHIKGSSNVAFSPDSKKVALGFNSANPSVPLDQNSAVQVINAADGERTFCRELGSSASRVRFSPNGKLLAAASYSRSCLVMDADRGHEKYTIPDQITDLSFSPDSKTLVAGAYSGMLYWYNAESGNLEHKQKYQGQTTEISFSPGGVWLKAVFEGEAMLINPTTKQERRIDKADVLFSPNENEFIVCGKWSGHVIKYKGNELMRRFDSYGDSMAAFSSDTTKMASYAYLKKNTVTVYDLNTLSGGRDPDKIFTVTESDPIREVKFSPNSQVLAVGFAAKLKLYNANNGKLISNHELSDSIERIQFSPDSKKLAATVSKQEKRIHLINF